MRRSAALPLSVIPLVLAGCHDAQPAHDMRCVDQSTQQLASEEWCSTPTAIHPGYVWYYGGSIYRGGYLYGGSFVADPGLRYISPSHGMQVTPGSGGRIAPVRGGFGGTGSGHGEGGGE